jgi:D-alanyl-lipoteichoic acid acyltransferase DltB (MBOAT superfamily)
VLFDSPIYVAFLVLVVVAYWALQRRRPQNVLLLVASYVFYGWWDGRFLLLMAASTTMDFLVARRIDPAAASPHRRTIFVGALVVNFAVLGVFKYFDFFVASLAASLEAAGIRGLPLSALGIVLPAGISFYTFQEIAYLVDVYDGRLRPADDLIDYALFISLFPHLIAGPIQRPGHLLPQVQQPRRFDVARVYDGILLIAFGLFRKCVVADNCALVANAAFDGRLGPPSLAVTLLGMYAFAWQIYGDFSGYSDIARGSAYLLGFHFMVNFRQPYLATSLQDFWRRWHISLSTWLRDYLYIRLGGNARGTARTYRNLVVTMLLGGLWHGANWTFVVWGALHGAGLAIERWLRARVGGALTVWAPPRGALGGFAVRWAKRILVFHVVGVAWIYFRAASIGEATRMLERLTVVDWRAEYLAAAQLLLVFALPLFLLDCLLEVAGGEYAFHASPIWLRTAVATAILFSLAMFSGNAVNAFIYFQF